MGAFNSVVQEAKAILTNELTWLNNVYGQVEKLKADRSGKKHFYPALPVADRDEYDSLEPSENLKNYCFFWSSEPEKSRNTRRGEEKTFVSNFNIIFWVDTRLNATSIESIRLEVVDVITNKFFMRAGSFKMHGMEVEPDQIFKDFSFGNFNKQMIVKPFAGIRVYGEMKTNPCFSGNFMTS